MQLITLRLDRVFDVACDHTRQGTNTVFSFESDGYRHFSVKLTGRHTLRNGMLVTAILARHNDWESLQGWRDHETGEIIYDVVSGEVVAIPFALILTVAAVDRFDSSPGVAVLLVMAALALVAGAVLIMLKRLANLKQLKDSAATVGAKV